MLEATTYSLMNALNKKLDHAQIKNQETIALRDVPVFLYEDFYQTISDLLKENENHCVNYYAFPIENVLKFIACIANDRLGTIALASYEMPLHEKSELRSLSTEHFAMHIFEREISENFDVNFIGHPWLKPVRYAFNRADKNKVITNYPFYQIDGQELHQVGVGPIHAGVIEPGHFRFLCNGENVLHLEIQLGWQHRGIEDIFLKKTSLIQRTVLMESIAGDTAIGHSLAFAGLMESLSSIKVHQRLELERTIGLELERIAMHVGDLGNMNIGTAYQLAASVYGTLRTPAINYTQTWCGNRFGKGLIRVGGSHYPLTEELIDKLLKFLNKFEESFDPMCERLFSLPSALSRFENIGKVSKEQMELIGAVGMTARMAGIERDIRISHPFAGYKHYTISSESLENGDVWARAYLRKLEIKNSIEYIRELIIRLKTLPGENQKPKPEKELHVASDSLCVSLVEGWRGEICHCALTDSAGKIVHYKIKDPSLHNWFALALSLRDLEISDFPINNKSYNLSYCGHDL
jgi:Ni,Fe-hydrogenase III large subunit/Ni,Fe-hydrogenase III component G